MTGLVEVLTEFLWTHPPALVRETLFVGVLVALATAAVIGLAAAVRGSRRSVAIAGWFLGAGVLGAPLAALEVSLVRATASGLDPDLWLSLRSFLGVLTAVYVVALLPTIAVAAGRWRTRDQEPMDSRVILGVFTRAVRPVRDRR